MLFQTNAKNLDELDIAWAELRAFTIYGRVDYVGKGEFSGRVSNMQRALDRLAMFDSCDGLTDPMATKWAQMREDRPDKTLDHSTHNFWPFVGKLEPRLARACINLAVGDRDHAAIVDPFCGSGTILLEADLMGIRALGNDLDPFAIFLSRTKLTPDDREFVKWKKDLWCVDNPDNRRIDRQRDACPPRGLGKLDQGHALDYLRSFPEKPVDAIVTSPPYYDAINYNERHRGERQLLDLSAPKAETMGIGQSLMEYGASIGEVCQAMVRCLVPQGKIAIVTACYRGVDVPLMYEQALKSEGMRIVHRLKRPYRTPVLDVREDVILVVEKP